MEIEIKKNTLNHKEILDLMSRRYIMQEDEEDALGK
jgi:hypothetical protein